MDPKFAFVFYLLAHLLRVRDGGLREAVPSLRAHRRRAGLLGVRAVVYGVAGYLR